MVTSISVPLYAVVNLLGVLVMLRQSLYVVLLHLLQISQIHPHFVQLVIVQRVFHRSSVLVQLLVPCELLILILQILQLGFDVLQHLVDFLDQAPLLFHALDSLPSTCCTRLSTPPPASCRRSETNMVHNAFTFPCCMMKYELDLLNLAPYSRLEILLFVAQWGYRKNSSFMWPAMCCSTTLLVLSNSNNNNMLDSTENRLSKLSNTISTKASTAANPEPLWRKAWRSSCACKREQAMEGGRKR